MTGVATYATCVALFALLARVRWDGVKPRDPLFVSVAACGCVVAFVAGRPATFESIGHAALVALVVVAFVTDVGTGLVFDIVSIAAALVLCAAAMMHGSIRSASEGACVAGIPFAMLYALTRGRGLGYGDVKLAAVAGLGVGFAGASTFVTVAFVLGGLWSCALLLLGRARLGASIAFAPFLAAGAVVGMLWPGIVAWPIG